MTTPHLLGRPANLAKCLHRTRAAGGKVWSSEYSSLLKWSIIHTHWKPFFFFFSCNQKIVAELHWRGPAFSQNYLHGNQPTMGFWFLHQRGQAYSQVSNHSVCNVPPTLTAVECHKGYNSVCWEDSRCLPTVVGPFLIKDNERERLT